MFHFTNDLNANGNKIQFLTYQVGKKEDSFFFWLHQALVVAHRIQLQHVSSVSLSKGQAMGPLHLEHSLSHWITREVPKKSHTTQSCGYKAVSRWEENQQIVENNQSLPIMATHSSVLAWRIPGTAEPGGLLPMGSHRVGHD